TGGTMEVDGRPIEVTTRDDAGDPTKAVSAARELIGEGYDIIAGSTASGVAVQVARSPNRTRCCSSLDRPPPTPSPASTTTRSVPAARPTRTFSPRVLSWT